jgi:putative sterol carrier protein
MKQHLNTELAYLIKEPSLLARYQFALTSSQMRALAEMITGAGVYQADTFDGQNQEIILWNNRLDDGVHWHLAAESMGGIAQQESGTLPKFGLLKLGDKGIIYHSGDQPLQGRITISQWFESLIEHISIADVKDVDAVIQFDIQGERGFQRHLVFENGSVKIGEGLHARPTASIRATDKAWLGLINGEQTVEELFASRELEFGGKYEHFSGLVKASSLTPPGVYLGDHWRCEVNYFDALKLYFGRA